MAEEAPTTEEGLVNINTILVEGVSKAQSGSENVEYRTVDELLQIRADLERRQGSRQRYVWRMRSGGRGF
jgi:hypothetical protein